MARYRKHHITTSEGHRVIASQQGEYGWGGLKIKVTLNDGESELPRYAGVTMDKWEAQRLVAAINEAIEALT